METVLNHPLFMPILVTLVIIGAFPLVAGYIVLVERKVLADFQVRLGPMRCGPHGLQPALDQALLLGVARGAAAPEARARRHAQERKAEHATPAERVGECLRVHLMLGANCRFSRYRCCGKSCR